MLQPKDVFLINHPAAFEVSTD